MKAYKGLQFLPGALSFTASISTRRRFLAAELGSLT